MPEIQGTFIVLEGADGSGKTTQFKLLAERLKAIGYDVEVFDFPQYESSSSHFVRSYLNGEYGPASKVSPYTASLFYALDRYEAAPKIRKALESGKIVLSNRYVGSNMAHQGGKFSDSVQQRGFFIWEDSLEYELLGIPRPTINFFLRVPAEVSYKLISNKSERTYTKQSHDEHEKDIEHLRHSIKTYDTLCQLFPKDFKAIECTKDGMLLGVPAINNLIWEVLKPILPPKPPHKPHNVVVNLDQKDDRSAENTPQEEEQPMHAAKDIAVPNGELSFELKNISLLALHHLQTVSGVSSSVESIQWENRKYKYYAPSSLPKAVIADYKKSMDKIAGLHEQMQEEFAKFSKGRGINLLNSPLKGIVPLAALVSVKITAGTKTVNDLIARAKVSPYEEVRWLSAQITAQANKQFPELFKDSQSQLEESIYSDIIARLAKENLPEYLSANEGAVTLLEAYPRNEFDLLIDSIYPYSNLPKSEIKAELDGWSYNQKAEAFDSAIKQSAATFLENSYYKWSIVDDYLALSSLMESLPVENLQLQQPTPRYGYSVPEILEQAGIEELYMECFDESLKLYSKLQEADKEEAVAYAALLGHKSRWQFKTASRSLVLAPRQPANEASFHLVAAMKEKLSEVHPLIGEYARLNVQPQEKPKQTADKPKRRNRSRSRKRSPKPKK
jgi:dTMP kinase